MFGYSPRAGLPDTTIFTFASRPYERDPASKFRTPQDYQNYLAHNPHNDARGVFPIEDGDAFGDCDFVADDATEVVLRGRSVRLPDAAEYADAGITLEDGERVRIFELCRYLAARAREDVLATGSERRVSVQPGMEMLLQLDEWHHPDVVDAAARPSASETFGQLARVLETGNRELYRPSLAPNTHWRNWPEGGTL